MKIPPEMIVLMLRSAGAPKHAIEMVEKILKMGFNAFALKPAPADDPAWAKFGVEQGSRTGFYLLAQSPTSRAAIGIFLEGVDDEILKSLDLPAANAGQLGAPTRALTAAS